MKVIKEAILRVVLALLLAAGVLWVFNEAMKIPIAPIHYNDVDVIPGPP